MTNKKKRGRPKSENPDDLHSSMARIPMKDSDLKEAKAFARTEGYSFSAWVRMLISKEVVRRNRRKNKEGDGR